MNSSTDFAIEYSFDQKLIQEIEQTFPTLQTFHHNETEKTKTPVAKLSLKQRFAEFLYSTNRPFQSIGSATGKTSEIFKRNGSFSGSLSASTSTTNSSLDNRFSPKVNALDRLKDITPSLKIILHNDHVLLAVGDKTPVKIDEHIEQFLYYIDAQQIPPNMEEVLLGILVKNTSILTNLFIEGCFCVELTDNRTMELSPGVPVTVRQHKLLLRPSWSTVISDVQMMRDILPAYGLSEHEKNRVITEIERKIVFAVSEPLVLEPTNRVLPALTMYRFNANPLKEESVLQHRNSLSYKKHFQHGLHLKRTSASGNHAGAFTPKFVCLSIMEASKNRKLNGEIEISPVDTAASDSLPKISITGPSGVVSVQQIIRTVRFEHVSEDKTKLNHYITLFVAANPTSPTRFDGILLWGNQPDSSIDGWNQRFCIGNMRMVENYISFLKNLFFMYDQNMKFISDSASMSGKPEVQIGKPHSAGRTPVGVTIPTNVWPVAVQQIPVINPSTQWAQVGGKYLAKDSHLPMQQPSPMLHAPRPTTPKGKMQAPSISQKPKSPMGIAPHLIFSQ